MEFLNSLTGLSCGNILLHKCKISCIHRPLWFVISAPGCPFFNVLSCFGMNLMPQISLEL
ncbi:hypothetical protein P3L10_022142 [Capsicum annuum]